MIDILFLAKNRLEYTRASYEALRASLVQTAGARGWVFDDGSEDGTREYLIEKGCGFSTKCGNPTAVLNVFLEDVATAPLVAKIDNDVILPPGWLEAALAVMRDRPELQLLGLEAKSSDSLESRRLGYDPCDHVGGVFVARRELFEVHGPVPFYGTYSGFTNWQREVNAVRGWLSPAVPMFLLDRLPFDPWRALGAKYEARGWQRPWKRYTDADKWLWDWWREE